MSELNPGYTNCIECDNPIPENAARRCPVCNQRPLCGRCSAAHSETCQKPLTGESWNCAGCGGDFQRALSGWHCPECGKRSFCVYCSRKHAENRQRPPGFTCKLCGEHFADFADFTKHAAACRRPVSEEAPEVGPHLPGTQCSACGSALALKKGPRWTCPQCSPSPVAKASANYGLPYDCHAWFSLRKPTDEEAKALDEIRHKYGVLMRVLLNKCPNNPDCTAAIRQLKESMQTAISSIVCADAWQTPKGD